MDGWTEHTPAQLVIASSNDAEYRRLLEACQVAQEAYLPVMERMSREQRDAVEHYLGCCEAVGYRLAQIAFACGQRSVLEPHTRQEP